MDLSTKYNKAKDLDIQINWQIKILFQFTDKMIYLERKTKRATHISRGARQNSIARESTRSPSREIRNIHDIVD